MSTIPASIVVFASSTFGLRVLEALTASDNVAQGSLFKIIGIVSTPDAPQGRGQKVEPNIVTAFAKKHSIPVVTPVTLRNDEGRNEVAALGGTLYLVAGYGKIIPKKIIEFPEHGTLNIHPSLLPKYRGPSPIQSMILADEPEPGITLMELDEEMDHGPIVAAQKWQPAEWPLPSMQAETAFAQKGVELFVSHIAEWMNDVLKSQEQQHGQATFTRKFTKADAEIRPDMTDRQKYLTFCAFHEHPGAYFFDEGVRIKVLNADFVEGKFIPTMVVPAGKKPMTYVAYQNGKKGTSASRPHN